VTPKLVDPVRPCPNDTALWRTCTGCGRLSAMAPESERCDPCSVNVPALRVEHFRPTDLSEIRFAGSVLAAGLAEITRYRISDSAQWSGTAPEELARVHAALDRLATAMAETRTLLALVERRARRRAGRRARRGWSA
jgi:hypothetical protein